MARTGRWRPSHRRQGRGTGSASAACYLLGVPVDAVMTIICAPTTCGSATSAATCELDIDTRAAIIEARTPYLEAAFDVVRGDFGGPEAFAEKALGLDAKARERLRADSLEG